MPGKSSKSKKRFDRWQRIGAGQCVVCQEPAFWRMWVAVGVKDQYVLLCESHRREYREGQ